MCGSLSKRPKGFTLVEAMIGMALLAVIIGVVGESIRMAVRAHRRGEAHRLSQQLGRELLNKIAHEMATSISVGLLPNGGELVSGVVYPDYALALNTPFPGNLYRRERVVKNLPGGGTTNVDRVYNRLILTVPGKRSAQFKDSLSDYVFLEFVVPPQVANNDLPQNRLFRRAYRFQADPLSTLIPGLQLQGDYEVVNGAHFAVDPADPLSNPQMLEGALTPAQKLERCLLVELPHLQDEVQFSVEHDTAKVTRTSPLPRDPAYEPALFTVTVRVSIDKQENNKFLGSQLISQQVTIKSGF
ncbi:type II secretion system protein [bacterium]|nr:type II secretion system protein [bacterium]